MFIVVLVVIRYFSFGLVETGQKYIARSHPRHPKMYKTSFVVFFWPQHKYEMCPVSSFREHSTGTFINNFLIFDFKVRDKSSE